MCATHNFLHDILRAVFIVKENILVHACTGAIQFQALHIMRVKIT